MNILQRRMFAEGDVVNAGPQPRVDVPKLIQYYVSQGYNAAEIKEMIPNVSFSEIESVVSGLGGSVNPAIASPGADEFTGNINVFQEIPETKVVQRQAPKVELPKNIELDQIRKYIEATKDLGVENQILGLKVNFNLTDEEAKEYLALPETSIEMPDPSLASLDAVEVTEEPASGFASSDLQPNQIRDKLTNSVYQLPANFSEQVEQGRIGGTTLYSIINNRDFEFSPDVATALENFARMDEPFRISERMGGSFEERRGTFAGPGDFGYGAQEAGRGLANISRPILEGIAGFAGELAGGQRGRERFQDIIPGDEISKRDIGLARLLQIPGVSYIPPETADLSKQLEDLEKTSPPADTVTEDVEAEEEVATTTEETTEEVVEEKPEEGAVAEDVVATTEETVTETKPEVVPAGDFQRAGNVFSNPNFVRFVANLSKGLATSEDMASGLAKGAALAAEERGLRELEQQKLAQEIELERIEALGELGMKPTDAAKIRDTNKELTEQIKLFQKSQNNVKQVDEVISIVEAGGATGLSGLAGKLITEAATALGKGPKDWANVDARTRADAILKVLQQENIREILGESGRTISNLDREVIKDVFGNITFRTSPAEILKKLKDSREKTLKSANQTKGDIAASLDFFRLVGRPSVVAQQNNDLLQIIMSFNPESYSSDYADQVVDIDFRSQFNK
jgi:hypothetical protein